MTISASDIRKQIPKNLEKINTVLSPFYEKGFFASEELYVSLEDFKNVEEYLDEVYERSYKYINSSVQMAIDYLIKLNIWDYNIDRFNEEYQDSYYNIDEIFAEYFAERYQDIMNEESNIKFARNMERSDRSSWSGGGFGLSGAIKGAVQAELLNLATDAIRSAGDAKEDARDRASIDKLKKELLNDKQNLKLYAENLRLLICNVGWALCDFLLNKGHLENYEFDFNTAYARYDNIINSNLTANEKTSKLLECILMYPYYYDFYDALYDIVPDKSVYDLAIYFGFINIRYKYLNEFFCEFEPITAMPTNSPALTNEKFHALTNLLIKYKFMNSSQEWDMKFAENYRLIDIQEDLIGTYENLEKSRRVFNKKTYSTVEEAQQLYEEYVAERKATKQREENIEVAKGCLGTLIPLVVVGGIIGFICYALTKSGIFSALYNLFNSLGH